MKEIFDSLKHVRLTSAKRYNLLDTCFIWHMLEHPKEMRRMEALGSLAVTSFTVLELVYTKRKVKSADKKLLRDFVKKNELVVIDVLVEPGQVRKEKSFVKELDEHLLEHIEDPSDAVIAAVALVTKSDLYTKDKHHLFTAELENYFAEQDVHIYH